VIDAGILMHLVRYFSICIAMSLAVAGADDSWSKVREVKSGTELRIFKREAGQPLLAKMDEASDESLVVVVKNEQISIPKDQINRIDYRPLSRRVMPESRTVMQDPGSKVTPQNRPHEANVPTASTSSGLSIRAKPDFEVLYRRGSPPSKP
jgi:hypothetical protein